MSKQTRPIADDDSTPVADRREAQGDPRNAMPYGSGMTRTGRPYERRVLKARREGARRGTFLWTTVGSAFRFKDDPSAPWQIQIWAVPVATDATGTLQIVAFVPDEPAVIRARQEAARERRENLRARDEEAGAEPTDWE